MQRATLTQLDDDWTAALRGLRAVSDELTFAVSPGAPSLPEALEAARALGFVRVGLRCHAQGLDATRIDALARAGMTDLHLPLYGVSAAVHDYHDGSGGFDALVAAIAAARARSVTTVVTTPLTRSNARVLGEVPAWLMMRAVAAWAVAVPRTGGARTVAFDRVYPRLALALPYALHAIEQARRAALPAWVRGAPACLLGPYAARSLPAEPMDYGPMCEACPARARCPGVDTVYLARFNADELSPARVSTMPTTRVGVREAQLARMLAGAFDPPGLAADS